MLHCCDSWQPFKYNSLFLSSIMFNIVNKPAPGSVFKLEIKIMYSQYECNYMDCHRMLPRGVPCVTYVNILGIIIEQEQPKYKMTNTCLHKTMLHERKLQKIPFVYSHKQTTKNFSWETSQHLFKIFLFAFWKKICC